MKRSYPKNLWMGKPSLLTHSPTIPTAPIHSKLFHIKSLHRSSFSTNPCFHVKEINANHKFANSLEQVIWHGRCETKTQGNLTWYLDGAHTDASLEVAAKWFGDEQARCSPKFVSPYIIHSPLPQRNHISSQINLSNS